MSQIETYTENGVQYDLAGLLSTARHMEEKTMIRKILLFNIDRVIDQDINRNMIHEPLVIDFMDYQISSDVRWVVEHIMKLVCLISREKQKIAYNTVSAM
jgi:hypothetical protein